MKETQSTGNYYATQSQLDHAVATLQSFGESGIAAMAEKASAGEMENFRPVVVTRFSDVNEEMILLIPPGTHALPHHVIQAQRFIIGLPDHQGNYPTVMLTDIEPTEVMNSDTLDETPLAICHCEQCKFACLHIDASQPTIIEVLIASDTFSDQLLYVNCSDNVEIYNMASQTLRENHSWAVEAYGESMCRSQNAIKKGLDQLHEGGMKAIDAVFKPLVAFGYQLDKLLGMK